MRESYRVAVVGATGAVGNTMLQLLEERSFPVASLKLLASHRSAGEILSFKDTPIIIEELTHDSFEDVDVVFSSAGASVSREFIPTAIEKGALVIDNTSAFPHGRSHTARCSRSQYGCCPRPQWTHCQSKLLHYPNDGGT